MSKINSLIAAVLLTGISVYADDVKVISDKDSFSADNGKINLEMKDGLIKLADSKKEAILNISFMDKAGKEKLKPGRFNIESNKASDATVSVYTGKPEKILATFTVSRNSEYVLVAPGRDTNGTLLEMKSEISVLPDMLAEDYLYFPDKIKSRCRIPTESYCIIDLMNNGNSMAACMWATDDTKAYLGKDSPESKSIDYNLIKAGKHKKLYLGIISAPGIWHVVKEKLNQENYAKVEWNPPFDAQWLMTMKFNAGLMPLNNNNFDTWIIADKKNPVLRWGVGMMKKNTCTAWTSLYGTFAYPIYSEDNNIFARIPKSGQISYSSDYPFVIYAYKYAKSYYFVKGAFPKTQPVLPYDKLVEKENLLLHYIIQPSPENAYPATCEVTSEILRVFKDDQAEEKRDFIVKRVDAMNKFVDTKDKRFNEYRKWAAEKSQEMKYALCESKNLEPLADELNKYFSVIEKNYTDAKEAIKTPDEFVDLSAKYIAYIDDKNLAPEEKEQAVDKLCREIRKIGGSRDNLCAKMRLTVKSIRYHLTEKLTEKLSPAEEELVAKLRKECGDILWAKHGHEGK